MAHTALTGDLKRSLDRKRKFWSVCGEVHLFLRRHPILCGVSQPLVRTIMKPREPIQPEKLLSPLDQCLDKLDCSFETKQTRKLLDDKERRERLLLLSIRALLDSRDAPTWLKSVSGHVLYVNPAFESCTGVQAGEYCGRTSPEVWGPQVGAALEEGDRKAREAGHAVTTTVVMGKTRVQIRNWPVYMADQLMGVAGEYL